MSTRPGQLEEKDGHSQLRLMDHQLQPRRWICLDLFCGAGGAAWGYAMAGFEVIGVDCRPQPRYPFQFFQGDALTWLERLQDEVDIIHASPPCQRWSQRTPDRTRHPDWVRPTLARLQELEKPFVLENVPGARPVLRSALLLCGSMFGLPLRRHRLFQSNVLLFAPGPCQHEHCRYGVYGHAVWTLGRHGGIATLDEGRQAMGIGWMSQRELSQAVPPHYTWWIGLQVRAALEGGIHLPEDNQRQQEALLLAIRQAQRTAKSRKETKYVYPYTTTTLAHSQVCRSSATVPRCVHGPHCGGGAQPFLQHDGGAGRCI